MDKYVMMFIALWIVLAYAFLRKNEKFVANIDKPTTFIGSIDTSNIPLYQRVGGTSKCYSCEADAYRRSCGNSFAAIDTRPLRYYQSMPIPEIGHARMGYVT